jgi:hypothetical protein
MTLDKQLEADLDWRAAELAALRLQLATTQPGSTLAVAGLRALWIMLYAHYEGFVKFALEIYLDELERTGVVRDDCITALTLFSLEQEFRTLRSDLSSEALWEFFKISLPAALQQNLSFPVRPQQRSNLWPNLLAEDCRLVGINIPSLAGNEKKLSTLVARRNEIAHGKRNIIRDLDEYKKYEEAAFDVMYGLAIEMAEKLRSRSYLQPAAVQALPPAALPG